MKDVRTKTTSSAQSRRTVAPPAPRPGQIGVRSTGGVVVIRTQALVRTFRPNETEWIDRLHRRVVEENPLLKIVRS